MAVVAQKVPQMAGDVVRGIERLRSVVRCHLMSVCRELKVQGRAGETRRPEKAADNIIVLQHRRRAASPQRTRQENEAAAQAFNQLALSSRYRARSFAGRDDVAQ
ncbi:hypothetical protein [Paraburkholderia youngii]|uniref:hypothetical protein n=1 Tax=Paraburkholderia youngii TaxID=2782701 RepID=UPI003D1E8573